MKLVDELEQVLCIRMSKISEIVTIRESMLGRGCD